MRPPFLSPIFVLLAAMLAMDSVAQAAEGDRTAAINDAGVAQGQAIYTNGDAARAIAPCVACHGSDGHSPIPQHPNLAGQHADYLYRQLLSFKTPERHNPIMSAQVQALTANEMKSLAAYLAAQQPQLRAATDSPEAELGKKIYRGGIADKSVPACAGCHGPNGAGIPGPFPRLGGQHPDYTAAQLAGFKSGARQNSPQMSAMATRLSDSEIKALAAYIASMK